MKPIKCWLAQNVFENAVYAYSKKPTKTEDGGWDAGVYGDLLATNRLDKSPVRCVIITEEEYNKLREEKNDIRRI